LTNYINFRQEEKNLKSPVNYEIIKKGKIAFDAYCEYKDALLEDFFSLLKDFLFVEFLNSITNGKSLIKYNEKIYDYYNMIIDYYKAAVEAYDMRKDEIVGCDIAEIADGIYDVLECQINKFEEAYDKTSEQLNPISKEKEKIIDTNIKMFSKDLILIYDKINLNFNKFDISDYFKDIYRIYFSSVKHCFIQLNDIDSRKITSFYYEALKQEREALSIIIKIQADVLEKKIQYMEDEVIVQSILMKLREGYQHLSKQIDEMERELKEAVVYEDFISKFDGNFKNKISEVFKNAQRKNEYLKKHFEYCNSGFLKILKDNYEEIREIEKIESEVEEILFFSEKVISKFQFIYNFWKANSSNYTQTDFKEIIDGIAETIHIKIQNIREGVEEFSVETLKIISDIRKVGEYNELFLLCKSCLPENIESISLRFISIFDEYENKINEIKKKIFSLKKDNILFEVSTFEEIMNYSVSRMRNSQNVYVEEFVQTSDFVFDELRQVLSVIGVEVIAPKPHDLFNGKEHEVIMAEKNGDFKKGEVIKLVNSGYKEKDYVILRANIIAAK